MSQLVKAFGFRKYGRPMLADDGKVNHAAMQFGDDLIMRSRNGTLRNAPLDD